MMESPDHNAYTAQDETSRFYQYSFRKVIIVNTLTMSYVGHFKQVQVKITLYCKIPTCVHNFLYMVQRNCLNVPNTLKDGAKCNPKLAKLQTPLAVFLYIWAACSSVPSPSE